MISDNLATLYAPGDTGEAVRFRQGTVLAWDPATGQNTIDVAGSQLVDVPILNTGEAIALKAGHVVGLLVSGRSWFIVGRITPPGDANFAAASVAFGSVGISATNFAVAQTTMTTVVTATIDTPAWADEALIIGMVTANMRNPRTVADEASIRAVVDGGPGGGIGANFAPKGSPADRQSMTVAVNHHHLSLGPTITVEGQAATFGAPWTAEAVNIMNVDVIAVFKSNV